MGVVWVFSTGMGMGMGMGHGYGYGVFGPARPVAVGMPLRTCTAPYGATLFIGQGRLDDMDIPELQGHLVKFPHRTHVLFSSRGWRIPRIYTSCGVV